MKKIQFALMVVLLATLALLLGCPNTEPQTKDDPGSVWVPTRTTVYQTDPAFQLKCYVNTGTQKIASYGVDISYDTAYLTLDTTIGESGVESGPDGFLVAAVNANTAGVINISGFEAFGKTGGAEYHLFSINFIADGSQGTSEIGLSVNALTDETSAPIGEPTGFSGEVAVLP